MGCKDTDKKFNCGQRLNARCVFYDPDIPDCSELSDENCVTIEETTEDLYTNICEIQDDIDLSSLGDCAEIDYEEEVSGDIKVREALLKHEELLCQLLTDTQESAACPPDISCLNLDTSCLQDECETGFNSLEDLLQGMINTICTLRDEVNTLLP